MSTINPLDHLSTRINTIARLMFIALRGQSGLRKIARNTHPRLLSALNATTKSMKQTHFSIMSETC